jgi:DUF971 family protein
MTSLKITLLQVVGTELAIVWSDGAETYFDLQALRRACPCAACNGEADVMGDVERPAKEYGSRSFEMIGYEFVGGYGFQPNWGDGHRTGIYSFAYLRKLASRS